MTETRPKEDDMTKQPFDLTIPSGTPPEPRPIRRQRCQGCGDFAESIDPYPLGWTFAERDGERFLVCPYCSEALEEVVR